MKIKTFSISSHYNVILEHLSKQPNIKFELKELLNMEAFHSFNILHTPAGL